MKCCFTVVEVFLTSFKSKAIFAAIIFTFTQLLNFFPQSKVRKFTIYCVSLEFTILFHQLFLSKIQYLPTFTPTCFSFLKVQSVSEKFILKVALFKQSIKLFGFDSHLPISTEMSSQPSKFDCFVTFHHRALL